MRTRATAPSAGPPPPPAPGTTPPTPWEALACPVQQARGPLSPSRSRCGPARLPPPPARVPHPPPTQATARGVGTRVGCDGKPWPNDPAPTARKRFTNDGGAPCGCSCREPWESHLTSTLQTLECSSRCLPEPPLNNGWRHAPSGRRGSCPSVPARTVARTPWPLGPP
jgi:hypothetical protein